MTTPFVDPLWPASYGLHPDHCRDVLQGVAYDIPYDPPLPPVILDLGANVGAFCRFAVRRWKGAIIHAYEPHPGNFELLKRTREEMLPNENITLHQIAVSDKSGHASLYFSGFNCGEWTLMGISPGAKVSGQVEVETISALELPKADILKIDVEGAEVLILGTLKERISEFSAVMLECHAASIVGPIKGMLNRAGFLMTSEKVHSEHRVELCFVKLLEKQTVATLPIIPPLKYPPAQPDPTIARQRYLIPANRKRVLIACPAKGGTTSYWFSAYDQVMRLNHHEYDFEFVFDDGNNAINVARNIIAQYALEKGYWKVVQVDRDQFWSPEILIRLVSHPEQIVAAPYCKKRPGPVKWLMVAKPGAVMREDGMLECDFMGTGMLSTEVSALKQMVDFFPERRFVYEDEDGIEKEMTELFPIGLVGPNTPSGRLARIKEVLASDGAPEAAMAVVRNIVDTVHPAKARLLGEDYGFSALARKAGLQLWCDTKNVVGHVGDIVFPIGPDKLSVAAGIPTHNLNLDAW